VATFVFLDKLSAIDLYLDTDSERTIDATQPANLFEPTNMEHLDQPLFLLGHGVEDPTDGIHGDEEYPYVVELPTANPFDEPGKWTVKVSGHSAFPAGTVQPTKRSSELAVPRVTGRRTYRARR
jgi:hypothetical protein